MTQELEQSWEQRETYRLRLRETEVRGVTQGLSCMGGFPLPSIPRSPPQSSTTFPMSLHG